MRPAENVRANNYLPSVLREFASVTDEDFQRLQQYYNEDEIVELMTPLLHTAFLNRWNDTMGTPIEEIAFSFGKEYLQNTKWEAGKHSR